MRFHSVLICFLALTFTTFGQTDRKFSPEELKEDLNYLKRKYFRSHPNLYQYVSRKQLDKAYDSIENELTDSLTEIEFYHKIRGISRYVKDGHSVITLSKKTLRQQFSKKKLPIEIKKWNSGFFILNNYSGDTTIQRGCELLAINDVPISTIFQTIKERQSVDGFNETFAEWSTLNWFMAKYGLNYGYPDRFKLKIKVDDHVQEKNIAAITVDSMRINYKTYYGDKVEKPVSNRGVYLHQLNDSIAILKIKTFSSSILRKRYKQNFRKSIRKIFQRLDSTKTTKLILDLRGNLGGESTNGNYLLSYLVEKPFKMLEWTDMARRNHRTGEERRIQNKGLYWRIRMAKKWNKTRYKGKLFAIIDGGSFSCTGIVSSNLERYTNCVFIGEEAGGNSTRISGAGDESRLPNTKIRIKVPVTRYTIRPFETQHPTGVKPNVPMDLTKAELLSYKDIWLLKSIEFVTNY